MRQPVTVQLGDHTWNVDYAVLQSIADTTKDQIKDFGSGPAAVAAYLQALSQFMLNDAMEGLDTTGVPKGEGIDHHDTANIEHHSGYRLHCLSLDVARLRDWFLLAGHAAHAAGFVDKAAEIQKLYRGEERFPNHDRRRFFEDHIQRITEVQKQLQHFVDVALPRGSQNANRGRSFSVDLLEARFKELDLWDDEHRKKVDFARKLAADPSQVLVFMQNLLAVLTREPVAEVIPSQKPKLSL